MSVQRYNAKVFADGLAISVESDPNGKFVLYKDHQQEIERLRKIIDAQSVDIKSFKKANTQLINDVNRLKPSKQHMYLVQWWFGPHDPIMAVKHYDALEDFLSDLIKNASITDITVSALNPVKVTRKQVLTVEL